MMSSMAIRGARTYGPAAAFTLLLHAGLAVIAWQALRHAPSRPEKPPVVLEMAVQMIDPPKPSLPARTVQEPPPKTAAPKSTPQKLRPVPPLPEARQERPSEATEKSTVATPAAPPAPMVAQTPTPAPISPPRFDAAYLNNPRPAYPLLAKRMGEQGKVVLRVRVTPDGQAEKIELHASSGSARLDEAAKSAVAQWRFIPARQGSEAVAAWVLVPLVFRLDE